MIKAEALRYGGKGIALSSIVLFEIRDSQY